MTLIKSISGIRGTIGGSTGEGLNPLDIVKFTSAYATLIRKTCTVKSNKIVVGRDARLSGEMVKNVVVGTLMGMGWDVVDIDLASTPTTELAVTMEGASGGIILTASHNPKQWNALKLLNEKGEFLNKEEGNEVLRIAEAEAFEYAEVDKLGTYRKDLTYNQKHIDSVLALDLVDVEAIRKADFHVAIDCVNSVGGIILPQLFEALGVKHVEKLYCEPTGNFQHNPEPLEKNLGDIMNLMKAGKNDVAFVVDPDVDRLAIICEDGRMYGEEYTLVSVADYILKHTPGSTVSNLSSTRALRDVTRKYGQEYFASAVGEVNVTTKMKEVGAVIGGEGNGGVVSFTPTHRRFHLPRQPLRTRCVGRYRPFPEPPGTRRQEGERTACHLSRLLHGQEPCGPDARHRRGRHPGQGEGNLQERGNQRHRRCED